MKKILFAILIVLIFQNCHFKLKVKAAYYNQEELVNYAKEKNYLFDLILRYKKYDDFIHREKEDLKRINFMNLYSKDNFLIKKTIPYWGYLPSPASDIICCTNEG